MDFLGFPEGNTLRAINLGKSMSKSWRLSGDTVCAALREN